MTSAIKTSQILQFSPQELDSVLKTKNSCSRVQGVFKDMAFSTKTYLNSCKTRDWGEYVNEVENAEGLCAYIHGLGGNPATFSSNRQLLTANNPTIATYQPEVSKRGNCSISEASHPIIEKVHEWALTHPNKPIAFASTSNGSRISAYVIAQLKKSGVQNPMKLSAISGPFSGSTLAGYADSSSFTSRLRNAAVRTSHCAAIAEELAYGSATSQEILAMLRDPDTAPDESDFYGTPADTKVLPVSSAFPLDVQNASYFLVSKEGHSSIVEAVSAHQLDSISSFFTNYKN